MASRQDVEFRSEGIRVRGHLYLPEGRGRIPRSRWRAAGVT